MRCPCPDGGERPSSPCRRSGGVKLEDAVPGSRWGGWEQPRLVEATAVVVPGLVAICGRFRRAVRAAAVTLGLVTAAVVVVHLSHGLIEMHFYFFVMMGVIALYQDWLPFLLAIGYVAVQHGVVGV